MRRAAIIIVVFTLAVAACGGDDAEEPSTSDAGVTTTAPAGTSAATAPQTTTAVAESTTTVAQTTTTAAVLSGPDSFIAAAVDFVGTYEGTWNNTTFGSSGSISLKILEANTDAGFVLFEIDLGGSVFGGADPDPFVTEIFTDAGGLTVGFGTFFRSSTFEIDETGHFTLTAGVADLTSPLVIDGGVVGGGFEGTYSIEGLAEGTWTAGPTS